MARYIELDAVLAEIEKRIRACGNCYILDELASLHRTFDSLEVTEVAKITQHDIKIYINNKAQKGE